MTLVKRAFSASAAINLGLHTSWQYHNGSLLDIWRGCGQGGSGGKESRNGMA